MAKVATAQTGHPTVVRKSRSLYEVESASKTLVTYRVSVDTFGNMTCLGNSLGERCWPFYQRTECKHTRSVLAFLHESEPVKVVVRKRVPLSPMGILSTEHAVVPAPGKVGTVTSFECGTELERLFGYD